jgi:hypothetical protein
MALTAQEQRRLAETRAEIDQIEHRLGASHALGDSHSSQGISSTFNDNARWRTRLGLLRAVRERLEAKQAGEPLPPAPGVNLSYYRPETGRCFL